MLEKLLLIAVAASFSYYRCFFIHNYVYLVVIGDLCGSKRKDFCRCSIYDGISCRSCGDDRKAYEAVTALAVAWFEMDSKFDCPKRAKLENDAKNSITDTRSEMTDRHAKKKLGNNKSLKEHRRRLKFAVVCSSNQNRSMEAHLFLRDRGFDVKSYGTGSCVKIPGPSIDRPNMYEFDSVTYTANGMLDMLDRNRRIKPHPEKFQHATEERFDVIITCETRIFDETFRDMQQRESDSGKSTHICNLDIKDTHESATDGAFTIVQLAKM
eukprot:gene10332-2473_t